MKHLIVGDVHGFHKNLRLFLEDNEVIDAQGEPINRDEYKVYCVGDLIDGNVNRGGDLLNLEWAERWFDGICIGNHEFAFLGGKEFGSRRKHDRKTARLLLNLIDKEVYVPAIVINNTLLTHGGLDEHFGFESAVDAYEYIRVMWELAPDLDEDVMIFDATGTGTYGYSASGVAGIFQHDWADKRNSSFSQVVGHSTFYTGPVFREYGEDDKTVHWNVDVGGKTGKCIGGIVMDDVTGEVEVRFFGERNAEGFTKQKKTYPPKGDVMTFDPKAGKDKTKDLLALPVGASSSIPLTQKSTTPGTTAEGTISTGPGTKKQSKKQKKQTARSSKKSDKAKKAKTLIGKTIEILPVSDLDDIDIAIITDPIVLQAYRDEVTKGNDVTLREMVDQHPTTIEVRNGVTHIL